MSTQHIVYFLHAEADNYCKIGYTTLKGLPERISEFERGKDTPVTKLGYQLCDSEQAAKDLEKILLNEFNRVEFNSVIKDKELLRIDPDLVIYIQGKCDTRSINKEYLKSLIPIPDYDAFDEEAKLKIQKHDDTIRSAENTVNSEQEKYNAAKQALEDAKQTLYTAQEEKQHYLEDLAKKLWREHWEIRKIAESTGLSETHIKNLVYERIQSRLV